MKKVFVVFMSLMFIMCFVGCKGTFELTPKDEKISKKVI